MGFNAKNTLAEVLSGASSLEPKTDGIVEKTDSMLMVDRSDKHWNRREVVLRNDAGNSVGGLEISVYRSKSGTDSSVYLSLLLKADASFDELKTNLSGTGIRCNGSEGSLPSSVAQHHIRDFLRASIGNPKVLMCHRVRNENNPGNVREMLEALHAKELITDDAKRLSDNALDSIERADMQATPALSSESNEMPLLAIIKRKLFERNAGRDR